MDPDRDESDSSGGEESEKELHASVQSDVKTSQMWDELQKDSAVSEKAATKANKANTCDICSTLF